MKIKLIREKYTRKPIALFIGKRFIWLQKSPRMIRLEKRIKYLLPQAWSYSLFCCDSGWYYGSFFIAWNGRHASRIMKAIQDGSDGASFRSTPFFPALKQAIKKQFSKREE